MSITGEPDGHPPSRATLGDSGTGMLMCISILASLHKRKETGKGVHLQVAMQDAMLHYIRNSFWLTTRPESRRGAPARNARGEQSACDIYPCAPGGPNDYVYVYTSRGNPQHWPRLLEGDRAQGPDRRSALSRRAKRGSKNQAEIDRIITSSRASATSTSACA
jgi:formyl-CoA transferase